MKTQKQYVVNKLIRDFRRGYTQVQATARALRDGMRITKFQMWNAGIADPVSVMSRAKSALLEEGLKVVRSGTVYEIPERAKKTLLGGFSQEELVRAVLEQDGEVIVDQTGRTAHLIISVPMGDPTRVVNSVKAKYDIPVNSRNGCYRA
jgi:hypothetical protein